MAALFDSFCGCYMAQTSDNLARDYGISARGAGRLRAGEPAPRGGGLESGRLAEEVVPVEVRQGKAGATVERDDHLRPDTTLEVLAELPTAFDEDGFVTAGNASGIVDGAAMMLLSTEERARGARAGRRSGGMVGVGAVGVEPSRMGIGPAPAIRAALDEGGHDARPTSTCSRSTRRSPARSWR